MATRAHPCPFCRLAVALLVIWEAIHTGEHAGVAKVHCRNCGATGPMVAGPASPETEHRATEAWNRRKPA